MKKIIITLFALIVMTILQGEEMNPEVNFYTKGKLMWLIDNTENNKSYRLQTINELKDSMRDQSYENYLNRVNMNPQYKYSDWRLPTKEELLSLTLSGSFIYRLFASKEKRENQICIDTNIFYDHKAGDYYTSTKCEEEEGYYSISFDCKRFEKYTIMNSKPCHGVIVRCNTGNHRIRFVRDIK